MPRRSSASRRLERRSRAAWVALVAACEAIAALAAPACGGSSGSSTSGSSSSGAPGFVPYDAPAEATVNPSNCVAPGTISNPSGVGGYCTPGGQECAGKGPDGAVTLCTADFNGPSNGWFCTVVCETDAACGGGAVCITGLQGQACVPADCVALFVDGSADAGGLADAGDVADARDVADAGDE